MSTQYTINWGSSQFINGLYDELRIQYPEMDSDARGNMLLAVGHWIVQEYLRQKDDQDG